MREHLRKMARIRAFEERLLEAYGDGVLRGTTHTSIGQEATAVAATACLRAGDCVVSNHRSHGHFIASVGDVAGLLHEITGSSAGVCRGYGGSQHLHSGNFYSNGVLGGTVPVATGIAMAQKHETRDGIVLCFLGDGTLAEGVVYESFNLASLWALPILFVIENNRHAQSTPVERHLAGSIIDRPRSFGIEAAEIESNDIAELIDAFERAEAHVRSHGTPFCQVVHSYRLGPHSKGDDDRDPEELARWWRKEPLVVARTHFSPEEIEAVVADEREKIAAIFDAVAKNVEPIRTVELPLDDDLIPKVDRSADGFVVEEQKGWIVNRMQTLFADLFARYPTLHMIGEDIADPYGGAFKVTRGLEERFPDRVHSSPVSEAGITGLANGMALRGLRPIVEFMFGDFTALAMDQILNHATKFSRMYGGSASCPVIFRTPMGGYRGYGATHSQSLEKFFLGVPGLVVTAMGPTHDIELLWERMLGLDCPCLHIENKSLYAQRALLWRDGSVGEFHAESSGSYFPTHYFKLDAPDAPPDLCLFAYGGLVAMALEAARNLFVEDELVVEVVVPSQLSPIPVEDLARSLSSCRKGVVLEEGTRRGGWGAEVVGSLHERMRDVHLRLDRYAAADTIIPVSERGERMMLPSIDGIIKIVRSLYDEG